MPEDFKTHLATLHTDAVLWKAQRLYNSNMQPDDKQKGITEIAEMLLCIQGDIKRDAYAEEIIKTLKIKPNILKNALTTKTDDDTDKHTTGTVHKLPEWANKDRVYNYALDWQENAKEHTGYYFTQSGGQLVQLTNFVLTPLYHIYDRTGGNRRLAKLHNAINPDKYIELSSKSFISLDKFEETLTDEGYYYTREGFTKSHLKRLFGALGNRFPKANELKFLGWQQEGFFAYSDALYTPITGSTLQVTSENGHPATVNSQPSTSSLQRFNDIGIAKFRGAYYYSPASSSLYKSERKDEEGKEVNDDDPLENDKHLHYQPTRVTFEQWSQMMVTMHSDAGMPLVAYALISLFKDIIVSYEKCPILYGYGLVQSGKSTWAEGLYYLFFDKQSKPFNLNQGTIYAFFNRLERFRNCPQLFNEFDEDYIDEDFFRAFKAFYDGEGRDKGKGIKGKTETQKTNCTVVLIGQTLTTKDGASVLIRSVPVKFHDPGERTEAEKINFDTWTRWTNEGMNGCLTEVLQHRQFIKKHFFQTYNEELVKLKNSIRETGEPIKERIAKNYCIFLTVIKLISHNSSLITDSPNMQLGFTYQTMFDWCRTNIIGLSRMISEVDNLATFWKTVEFLLERGEIHEHADFKIITETKVRKTIQKEDLTVNFDEPTQVLYIRLVKMFPLYQREYRLTGHKPINERTLVTYFESNKAYIGNNRATRFGNAVSSCYMFDYRRLGINLERGGADDDTRKAEEIQGEVCKGPEEMTINPQTIKTMFSLMHASVTPRSERNPIDQTKIIYTKCFTSIKTPFRLGDKLRVKGHVEEKQSKDYTSRTMEVTEITVLTPGFEQPKAMFQEDPFPN